MAKKKFRQGDPLPAGPLMLCDAPTGFIFRGLDGEEKDPRWYLLAARIGLGPRGMSYRYVVTGDPTVIGKWSIDNTRLPSISSSRIVHGDRLWPAREMSRGDEVDPLRPSLPFDTQIEKNDGEPP